MQFSLNEIADKLAEVARDAGNLIMALYDSGAFATTEKADDSPVTTADIKASEFIITELQNAFPDIPVLSEESSHEALSTRAQWSSYFLIDPIDGTQEFIARSGDFAVNIAYVEQRQPATGLGRRPGITAGLGPGHGHSVASWAAWPQFAGGTLRCSWRRDLWVAGLCHGGAGGAATGPAAAGQAAVVTAV